MCSNVGLADIGTLTVINVSPNKVWLWRPILLNPHTGTLAHETTTLCVRSHSGPYPGSALRPHPGPLPCPVPPLFPAGQLLTRNLQSISWLHARAMFLVGPAATMFAPVARPFGLLHKNQHPCLAGCSVVVYRVGPFICKAQTLPQPRTDQIDRAYLHYSHVIQSSHCQHVLVPQY